MLPYHAVQLEKPFLAMYVQINRIRTISAALSVFFNMCNYVLCLSSYHYDNRQRSGAEAPTKSIQY